MVFRIQNRVARGQANTVGIRMNQHREQLAKAVEAASIVSYSAYLNGAHTSSSTTNIGLTPQNGCKADMVAVHIGTQGTGAVTVDLEVDGTSILSAPIDLAYHVTTNPGAATGLVVLGTLTAAAKAAIAAKKLIRVVVVGAASGAANLTVEFHSKVVHNATGA